MVEHLEQVHKLLDPANRVPFEEALEQVQNRHGRGVFSQRHLYGESEHDAIAKSIQRNEIKIAGEMKKRKSKQLSRLQARGKILARMHALGYAPHANHLVAALAREHGLEAGKLLPVLNDFERANSSADEKLFLGNIRGIIATTSGKREKSNLLFRISELLHAEPVALTSKDIARSLGLETTKNNFSLITFALGVLDLAGFTYKLPKKGVEPKWCHGCYSQHLVTIPRWNLGWKMLFALREGPKRIGELSLPVLFRKKKYGSESGLATSAGIKYWLNLFSQAGVIHRQNRVKPVELSETGAKLLEEQDGLNYLHPDLRVILLGLPRAEGLFAYNEEKVFQNIVRWARVKREIMLRPQQGEKVARYAQASRIAKQLRVPIGTVQDIMRGKSSIYRISDEKMVGRYLPRLRGMEPLLAEIVEQELAAREAQKHLGAGI